MDRTWQKIIGLVLLLAYIAGNTNWNSKVHKSLWDQNESTRNLLEQQELYRQEYIRTMGDLTQRVFALEGGVKIRNLIFEMDEKTGQVWARIEGTPLEGDCPAGSVLNEKPPHDD